MPISTKQKQILFAILLLAFIVRVGYTAIVFCPGAAKLYNAIKPAAAQRRFGNEVGKVLHADETVYDNIGQNLARGKGFVFDFGPKSAVAAPGYPFFLGLVYKIFGHNYLVVAIIQVILSTLTCLVVYLISQKIFNDPKVGLLGTLLTALYFPFAIYSSMLLTETLFIFLLALFFLSLITLFNPMQRNLKVAATIPQSHNCNTAAPQHRNTATPHTPTLRHSHTPHALLSGFLLGLVCLTRPTPLLFPLFLLLIYGILWLSTKLQHRKTATLQHCNTTTPQHRKTATLQHCNTATPHNCNTIIMLILAMIITLTPWTIRNYKLYHKFIPVSSQGGRVFTAGIDRLGGAEPDVWKPEYERETPPLKNLVKIRPKFVLVKFSRLWFNLGFKDPPSKKSIVVAVTNAIFIIFAILGYILVLGNWKRRSFPILLFLIYLTLVQLFATCKVRYVLPVIPYLMLLASNGFWAVISLAKTPRR